MTLRTRTWLTFGVLIVTFAVAAAAIGAVLINRTTLNEAQRRVNLDLRAAWAVLNAESEKSDLVD